MEITGEIDPSKVGNTAELKMTHGGSEEGTTVDAPKGIKVPPAIMKKIAKLIKDRQPKHENFRMCHKKCPNFKTNRCWVLSAGDQKQCWDNWHDAKGNPTGIAPCCPKDITPKDVEPEVLTPGMSGIC